MVQNQPGLMWHIDAWDALGGRAFASQRERNKELADCGDSLSPTVYIGPPGFQPEQIANIAVAIAACHSNKFAPRVPPSSNGDRPDELSFSSASAVAEFVRRAFIGGGRTRGGGAPVVEGGGPEGPPEEGNAVESLANFLQEWDERKTRYGEQQPQPDHDLSEEIQRYFSPLQARFMPSVENGAMQIIASVLGAFPHGTNEMNIEKWHAAASTLEAAISELGIWRAWHLNGRPMSHNANQYLFVQVKVFAETRSKWPSYFPQSAAAARYLLRCPFCPGNGITDMRAHLELFLDLYRNYEFHWQDSAGSSPLADRFEALFFWPLPHYVRTSEIQSVGQLLSAFVSSPGEFLRPQPGTLSIITFAAALLGSRLEDRASHEWRELAAANWLARSMPKYQFSAEVERFVLNPQLMNPLEPEVLQDEEDIAGVRDWEIDSSGADR